MRGPDPYVLAETPETPVQIVVGPDQRCNTADQQDVTDSMAQSVRTWGDDEREASAVLLSGSYQSPSEVGRDLLDALPAVLVSPAAAGDARVVGLLADEMAKDEPGQELVLDRLLDLLLVSIVRRWLAAAGADAPGWYRAQHDAVVGPALRLLRDRPAEPWTVASLAAGVGVSRAGLARRFTAIIGEPPMSYLAGWRLTLAADLLREKDLTVAAVARRVGYGSAFAFSAAFKRARGISPQEYAPAGHPSWRRTTPSREPRSWHADTGFAVGPGGHGRPAHMSTQGAAGPPVPRLTL